MISIAITAYSSAMTKYSLNTITDMAVAAADVAQQKKQWNKKQTLIKPWNICPDHGHPLHKVWLTHLWNLTPSTYERNRTSSYRLKTYTWSSSRLSSYNHSWFLLQVWVWSFDLQLRKKFGIYCYNKGTNISLLVQSVQKPRVLEKLF